MTYNVADNDARNVVGYLKEVKLPYVNAVVELTDDTTDELIYCYRVKGDTFQAPVYEEGTYTLRAGLDSGDMVLLQGVTLD